MENQYKSVPISTETLLLLQMKSMFESEFRKMESFRKSFNETFLEQKKKFAAINAQLHIIQTKLQSLESQDTPVPKQAWIRGHGIPWDLQRNMPSMNRRKSEDLREYDGLSGSESVHRECLMEYLEAMVKNMDLSNTSILDDLLGEGCLTQDEASDIKERPSRKDQVRKLIVLMAKRSAKRFMRFLETIERKCHYPYIAKDIKRLYDIKIKEGRGSSCLICTIKRDVDIKDVIDKLCKQKIVDVEFLDLVISHSNSSRSQSSLWEVVFSKIDQASNRRHTIEVLQNALYAKYERLSAALGTCQLLQLSSHVCTAEDIKTFDPNMKVPSSSWRSYSSSTSSISELSTTSDFKKSPQKIKRKKGETNNVQDSKSLHYRHSKNSATSDGIIESSKNVTRGQTLESTKTCDNVDREDKTDKRVSLTTQDNSYLADAQINANIPYCISWLISVEDTSPVSDSEESNIKSLDSNVASDLIVQQIDDEQSVVSTDSISKQLSDVPNFFQDESSYDAKKKDKDDEYQYEDDKKEYVTLKSSLTDSGYSKEDEELSSPDIKETDDDDTKQIPSQKFLHHNSNQITDNTDKDSTGEHSGMVSVDCKSVEVVQSNIKNDSTVQNEVSFEQ